MKQRHATTSLEALTMAHAAWVEINAKPYDGFHGHPPEWVPPFFRQLFNSFRDELTLSATHSPAKIVEWIAAYPKDHEARESRTQRGVTPIPSALKDRVSMLAWIHVAVTLAETQGQDAGMRYLLGSGPAGAYKDRLDSIEKLKGAAQDRRADAIAKHAALFESATTIQATNPGRMKGDSVRWVAGEVAKQLGRPADRDKIRDALRSYKDCWGKHLSLP